ncbi:hypothetical protein OIV83_001331 [Microbotryomycetes sp. JL201]|nr:hypothetical protein OIV83_001331 [Microbotryomycetes sp. JL201]
MLASPQASTSTIPPRHAYGSPQSRPLSTSSHLWQAHKPSPTSAHQRRSAKIETLPFVLQPTDAVRTCDAAAHSAFGLSTMLSHMFARFGAWLGFNIQTGVRRLAFKPVLLPTWRVDLAMQGKALLAEDVEFSLLISAVDAPVPGFSLPPLSNLSTASPWASEPETFDESKHLKQLDMDVTLIDFTTAPLRLLARLAGLPRTNLAQHGLALDPSAFKASMFAAYPLFVPVYMGEYEMDGKRVTTAAFAASEKTAFAIFPSFVPEASWLPGGDALEISVAGAQSDFSQEVPPNIMQSLKPKLGELVKSNGPADGGEKMAMFVDPCDVDEMDRNPRVMAYSKHAEHNREYIDALQGLAAVEAMSRQIEGMGDNVRAFVVGPRGPKIATRDNLMEDVKQKLRAAKQVANLAKPAWLTELEQTKPLGAGYNRGR